MAWNGCLERSVGVKVSNLDGQCRAWHTLLLRLQFPHLLSQKMKARAFGVLPQGRVQHSLLWGHAGSYTSPRAGLGVQTWAEERCLTA